MSYRPKRVVSLQPSASVTLRDIGKLSALVGCTKYCRDVCPEIDEAVCTVADSWTAQAEQIAQLRPDLVIGSVPYQEKALAEIMKCGARFLGLAPKTLNDIYADIAAIAGIMNACAAGMQTIEKMQSAIHSVRSQTASLAKPRVFCEEWGKPLIASQAWVAELVEAAGGEFIAKPGAQIALAGVEELCPEVIIAAWCGVDDRVPLEKVVRARNWQNMPAVKNGRVYCIRDEYLNTPGSTLIRGLQELAAAIHPECFRSRGGLRRIEESAQFGNVAMLS